MTYPLEDTNVARAMVAAALAEADLYDAKIHALAISPRPTTIEGNIQATENLMEWSNQRQYFMGLADMATYLMTGKSTVGIDAMARRVVRGANR